MFHWCVDSGLSSQAKRTRRLVACTICLWRGRISVCAPNVIANVHHDLVYEWAVHAMWKELTLRYDGGDSGSKK